MATVQPPITQFGDVRGRVVPLPPEEECRRIPEAIKSLDELDKIGTEEEQRTTFKALQKAMNEDRLTLTGLRSDQSS